MGGYLDRLTADMKSAMRAREQDKLTVLRMIISDIKKNLFSFKVLWKNKLIATFLFLLRIFLRGCSCGCLGSVLFLFLVSAEEV